jgi:hypothetical protein
MWTEEDIRTLEERARQIRRDVVTMIHLAGDGHPGPALSVADIVAALYFKVLRVNPADPHGEGRDRFILSKGHAAPILYAALARAVLSPEVSSSAARVDLRGTRSCRDAGSTARRAPGTDLDRPGDDPGGPCEPAGLLHVRDRRGRGDPGGDRLGGGHGRRAAKPDASSSSWTTTANRAAVPCAR